MKKKPITDAALLRRASFYLSFGHILVRDGGFVEAYGAGREKHHKTLTRAVRACLRVEAAIRASRSGGKR